MIHTHKCERHTHVIHTYTHISGTYISNTRTHTWDTHTHTYENEPYTDLWDKSLVWLWHSRHSHKYERHTFEFETHMYIRHAYTYETRVHIIWEWTRYLLTQIWETYAWDLHHKWDIINIHETHVHMIHLRLRHIPHIWKWNIHTVWYLFKTVEG